MSAQRKHNERNQQILKTLLREPANKSCADCKTSKNPRWASWNLGVFVCIRCSGIHRSMGTHISRVKSVDLDSWTDEQVKSMVMWGNERANLFWEDKLPDNYVPDESKIENFIRTKYEMRKWKSDKEPGALAVAGKTTEQRESPASLSQQTESTSSLLDGLSTPVNASVSTSTAKPTPAPAASASQDLFSSDLFGSAPSRPPQPQTAQNSRPDLKKSILSLYSKPSPQTQPQIQQPFRSQPFTQPVQPVQPQFNYTSEDPFKNVWS
ncbi:hypothetical protein KL949_004389 [Ogataea haglerorum]|uniref:Arf-GAP domain-containing protein n=1 Tax=Ogataea haglerorum TaxID=1937702 RepID=A0ABQ7RL46_9ASCO|nr:hypothetical protein KL914_001174 [Ogataea haglerorum]KAG7710955.1 hypothetical protein KL950_000921 [Ogataea haglerorum]KAG7714705.1 hypothetical protein KL913_004475 [Ogataea haglerorum]KAG7715475.1 hypothetical protein KL949_004389 [Ogataea haglerorum]KAG7733720.1 hypothetical protein KL948_000922 [Ogataea haglerorum]